MNKQTTPSNHGSDRSAEPNLTLNADRQLVVLRAKPLQRAMPKWIAPLVFVVLIAVWEGLSVMGWISPLVLPSPREIFTALQELWRSGELWLHMSASLQRLAIGWSLGSVLGIAVGITIGLSSLMRAGLLPLVSALFPVPKIALLPLFIIWFGIGESSKVATIAFGAFFPTVIATYSAVDGVDRQLVRMAQSFGVSGAALVRKVILPGALPGILSGFRISVSIAIILLVAAEMIGAQKGIGTYILTAGALFRTDQLMAGVALLSLLGVTLAWLIGLFERYFLRWRG